MAGLSVAMITGKSALSAQQKQMNVIANNIANAGRVGHHKQSVSVTNNTPMQDGAGSIGTGIHVESVLRFYDEALEKNLRQATQQEGYHQSYTEQLELLESLLAPDGSFSLGGSIDQFANALQDIANQPDSTNFRNALLAQANEVSEEFNRHYSGIEQLKGSILNLSGDGKLSTITTQLNDISEQIANLNSQISEIETRRFNPHQANELRDKRDELVLDLSAIADITVVEDSKKMYTVSIDGSNLVQGTSINPVEIVIDNSKPILKTISDATPINPTSSEIKGLMDAWQYLDERQTELWNFANTFSDTVNSTHSNGFDLDGNQGEPLFEANTPGNMIVSINNTRKIAASSDGGTTGNNENIMAIWNALNEPMANLNNSTILSQSNHFINEVATVVFQQKALTQGAEAGVRMFQEAVSQKSGVSIDEEMVSMLEVQRAYQASARFINVLDDMLVSILSIAN